MEGTFHCLFTFPPSMVEPLWGTRASPLWSGLWPCNCVQQPLPLYGVNRVSPHGPVSIRQASLAVLIEPVGRRLLPYTPWRYCRSIGPKALRDLHEGGHDLAVLHELRIATDLVLQATKMTAQSLGRVMSTLVVQERHLWLCLTDMKEQEKVQFLNAPESQTSLFGDAVESCAQQFSAAQKQTEAIKTSCAGGNLLLPLRLQPLSLLVAVGAAAAAFHQAVSWSRSQAGRPAHPGPRQTRRQAQVQEALRRASRRWRELLIGRW